MHLSELLSPDAIQLDWEPESPDALLSTLVHLASNAYHLERPSDILDLVRQREAKMSTAIGHGLAVPHAKCDHVSEVRVAVCAIPKGIEFRAPDKRPVRLAFLLISPTSSAGSHVRALSAISRITPALLDQLVAATSPTHFMQIVHAIP